MVVLPGWAVSLPDAKLGLLCNIRLYTWLIIYQKGWTGWTPPPFLPLFSPTLHFDITPLR